MSHEPIPDCLNTRVERMEDLLDHDGYGSWAVEVRVTEGGPRGAIASAGTEYRFAVPPLGPATRNEGRWCFRVAPVRSVALRREVGTRG